jgi:hypothetical protein
MVSDRLGQPPTVPGGLPETAGERLEARGWPRQEHGGVSGSHTTTEGPRDPEPADDG